jgi:hypothetical protein
MIRGIFYARSKKIQIKKYHSQNNGQIVEAGVYIFTFVISVP